MAVLFENEAVLHKRHTGETFIEYLERVEREIQDQARERQETREELYRERPKGRPSVQMDFWAVYRLMAKQGNRCYWCCHLLIGEKFHLDHVHPRARGGTDDLENLRIACVPCNLSKNASLPSDYIIELLS